MQTSHTGPGSSICSAANLSFRHPQGVRASTNRRATDDGQSGKEGVGLTEAAKEGSARGQGGQDAQAEGEEEDLAREVASVGVDPRADPVRVGVGLTSSAESIARAATMLP
jgi:hypothetical protein